LLCLAVLTKKITSSTGYRPPRRANAAQANNADNDNTETASTKKSARKIRKIGGNHA